MYIPLNKIITNLHTNGGEYSNKITEFEYIGFYWKDYKGKFYEGKNPNAHPKPIELIPFITPPPISDEPQQVYIDTSPPINRTYTLLRTGNTNTVWKNLPSQYFPQPTEDDYKLGVFTRYFCVKINEKAYLELNKDTYTSLIKQNSKWDWQYYLPFTLSWTLTGEESVVKQTNFNMVTLREQRNRRVGLKEFLKFNYLKFYKGEDFHVMSDGRIMEGKTHEEYLKTQTLVPNIQTSLSSSTPPSTPNNINRGGY